jgi:lysozyme family protein
MHALPHTPKAKGERAMKDIFSLANVFTMKWEGGYVNHPKDPGGATNYGVSLRWLKDDGIDVNGDSKIDIADIKALTPEKAAELFRTHFWNLPQLDLLPPLTAIVTYDAGINTGRGQAAKFLQRACNAMPGTPALTADGVSGDKTRLRVKGIVAARPGADLSLALDCIEQREGFHNQLAANSPYPDGRDYRSFLAGWLNRTRALKAYVSALELHK